MQPAPRVVLVVEDDPSLLAVMSRHLATVPFEVLTASDYQSAITQLRAAPLQAICIDLCLPNESGYELCERIREEPMICLVPILVTSERAFPEDMARAEEAGANAFLKKPFSMRHLTESVEMLIAGGTESRPPMRRLRWA
jgi:two-component system, OmpR family, alkaline phosphatase synthesis response regulator PhoP